MIRREEVRLKNAFRLMLLALAAPACSSSSADDGGTDASVTDTSVASEDGSKGGGGDATSPGADAARADSGGGSVDGGAGADASPVPACTDAAVYPTDGPREVSTCDYFKEFPCGLPPGVITDGCNLGLGDCNKFCTDQPITNGCVVIEGCGDAGVIGTGPLKLECSTCKGVGRRPEGLEAGTFDCEGGEVGGWFARVAHLEAASIAAFRALTRELVAHGAPRSLAFAAVRSARDEVRHTRATARLARRFGGRPRPARVRRGAPRSIEALALDNAVEGCVRETFGAMVATWQAARAEDAEVRRAMERIAADETRHAALAWAIASWAERELDEPARTRVRAAREAAIRTLRQEVLAPTPAALVRVAGVPSADDARAMVDAMAETIWS